MNINDTMPKINNLTNNGSPINAGAIKITIDANAIIKNIPTPKPVFVAFATVDGPSLTKVMYR